MGILGSIIKAIPVVGGLYTGIEGIIDNGKANTQLANANAMARGTYNLQHEYVDNYNRAGVNSLSGIPDAQKAYMMQNILRSGANALNTSNLTRNSSAAIGQIQQNQNDAYNQLMSQDAQQRLQNQQYLNSAASELGGQKVAKNMYESQLAEKDRDRALGQAQQLKAAAKANITNGFSSAIGSALGLATGGLTTAIGGLASSALGASGGSAIGGSPALATQPYGGFKTTIG